MICTISIFLLKYKVSLIINKSKSLLKWKLLLFGYVFNLDVQPTFYINHAWVISFVILECNVTYNMATKIKVSSVLLCRCEFLQWLFWHITNLKINFLKQTRNTIFYFILCGIVNNIHFPPYSKFCIKIKDKCYKIYCWLFYIWCE